MSWLRQISAIARKDLLVEWRSRSRVSGVFFFALALLVMVAFTTDASATIMRKQAGGALWLGLLLASTRSLDQSFQTETEQGALEGLVLWPVDPRALFYGKALANTVVLCLVAFALVPLVIALFDAPIHGNVLQFLGFVFFGSAALAAPGTMYALITTQARGASVLLPILLFPLVVPALLAASRGSTVVMEGDPMGQASAWLSLLVAFDCMHWALNGLLFTWLVEDG